MVGGGVHEDGRSGPVRLPVSVSGIRAAFTLIEMLLVLALIALFTSIFVINFENLIRQSASDSVESAFWDAVRDARTRAVLNRKTQWLSFDEKTAVFLVEESGGANSKSFSTGRDSWDSDTDVEVLLQKRVPPNEFSLIGGQLVDTREIPAVQFFADGTCTPFLVTMRVGQSERSIDIDPWTGAELLESDET